MFAIKLLGGIVTAVVAYFSVYYFLKIVDGITGKERGDLWVPTGFGSSLAAYFFYLAFNLTHGVPASVGLSLLVTVVGTLALIGLGWLCGKGWDGLFKLGDRLKSWAARRVGSNTAKPPKLELSKLLGTEALPRACDGCRQSLNIETLRLLTSRAERPLPSKSSEERKKRCSKGDWCNNN
jgi:hypothetical protein